MANAAVASVVENRLFPLAVFPRFVSFVAFSLCSLCLGLLLVKFLTQYCIYETVFQPRFFGGGGKWIFDNSDSEGGVVRV